MDADMAPLLLLLDQYIFSGVAGNFVYDLIKSAWEKSNQKTWTELYLNAFQAAVDNMRPIWSKYGDGDVIFSESQLQKVLNQDLKISIDVLSYGTLTDQEFTKKLVDFLQKRQALMIEGHNLNEADYEQLIWQIIEQVRYIFKRSILENEVAFRNGVITESQNNLHHIEMAHDYLRLHHDFVVEGMDQIIEILSSQSDQLAGIRSELEGIKQHLGLDRTHSAILDEINSVISKSKTASLFTEGICWDYPSLDPRPHQYFLAQEFNSGMEDLRSALSGALQELSLSSIRADDIFESKHILCKISGLIQSTPFGIYELTKSQNRNVYLELGIAIGLGKPFVLIKERDASVATIMDGIEYYPINHYLELKYQLGDKIKWFLTNIGNLKNKHIQKEEPRSKKVIVSHGDFDAMDFTISVAKLLKDFDLSPVILGDPTNELATYLRKEGIEDFEILGKNQGILLDEVLAAHDSAELGIYRIDKEGSANNFVALGIALATDLHRILINKENSEIPADLKGFSSVHFRSYLGLVESITATLHSLYKR